MPEHRLLQQQDGRPLKWRHQSRAHGSGRSQNVNVNKALDGGKQGHDGSAVIGWSGKEEEAVHVREHERRVVRVSLLEAFRDVPRDQGRVKPAGRRFHLFDGFSEWTQARITRPRPPVPEPPQPDGHAA